MDIISDVVILVSVLISVSVLVDTLLDLHHIKMVSTGAHKICKCNKYI